MYDTEKIYKILDIDGESRGLIAVRPKPNVKKTESEMDNDVEDIAVSVFDSDLLEDENEFDVICEKLHEWDYFAERVFVTPINL